MFQIDRGNLEDLEFLSRIEILASGLFPKNRIPQPPQPLPEQVISDALKNNLLFCARENEMTVGFAACHTYKNNLHLDEMAVLPEFGRRGIGSQLVEEVKKETQARELKACTLTTFSDIPWNRPFYENLGFEVMQAKAVPQHVHKMLDEEADVGLVNRIAMQWKSRNQVRGT